MSDENAVLITERAESRLESVLNNLGYMGDLHAINTRLYCVLANLRGHEPQEGEDCVNEPARCVLDQAEHCARDKANVLAAISDKVDELERLLGTSG